MKFTSLALCGAALQLAQAGPVNKRAGGVSDADILKYALTLEHLEAAFYEEGLKNYTKQDFMDAGMMETFYNNIKSVGMDEKSHEQFLTQALTKAGAKPVARCEYSFPSTDVKSFLALGNILEGVGVSAYLGAAASIMDKTYLTAAGSILTVEARHSAYLRAALGEAPSAQPFDNPLDFNEVYTVASPFIVSCPESNEQLPVKAFPSLTMSSMDAVMTGQKVELMVGDGFKEMNADDVHAAFVTVTGPVWADVMPSGDGKYTVTIPKGVAGQSYVVLTNGDKQATDDNILAGPAIIEVGPKMKLGGGFGGCGGGSGGMSMSSGAMPSPTMSWGMGSHSGSPSGWSGMPTPSMTGSATATPPVFTGGASAMASGSIGGVAGVFMAAVGLFL